MSTGYTAKLVEKGQSFQEFAMTCARAFGALIDLRDEPLDAPIPDKFEPSEYHTKALIDATDKLKTFNSMTQEQRLLFGENEKNNTLKRLGEWMLKDAEHSSRLIKMQAEVRQWNPPSPDHVELKNFMLQQIEVSLPDTGYIIREMMICRDKPAESFFFDALSSAEKSILYHQQGIEKDAKKSVKNTEWIRALRESLK